MKSETKIERGLFCTKIIKKISFILATLTVVRQFQGYDFASHLMAVRPQTVYRYLGGDSCNGDTLAIVNRLKRKEISNRRNLSVNLGNGECEFKNAESLPKETNPFGIAITSYPAAGMYLTWQHIEGLTGITVENDFDCEHREKPRAGIIKTHYPHIEGKWSWGNKVNQVIMLIRNPRWAMPAYHTLLHEIDYGKGCETTYEKLHSMIAYRPPTWKWNRWRDLRFEEELKLWSWHIDYWMGNGQQYWMELDSERNGQWPFQWLPENERHQDINCKFQGIECAPQTVVAYEYIRDPIKGPSEVEKIAQVLEGKPGLVLFGDEGKTCIWHKTMENKKLQLPPSDYQSRSHDIYQFTLDQMGQMRNVLISMKNKYSSKQWHSNQNAKYLVEYFVLYIEDIESEMADMESNVIPTPSPNPQYRQGLEEWYKDIGRGDRYNKDRVQQIPELWGKISHFYGER